MAKRKIYDEKFKANAIIMLEMHGYPENAAKLQEIADHLGVPGRTLRRWFNRETGTPPDNVVTEVKKELSERLTDLAHKLVDKALEVISDDDPSIQQIVTSLGIVIDKSQLLTGKATERKELTGKEGGAIETKITLLSELSDDDLNKIIAGQPAPS